jgi:hypothetical protein
MCTVFLSIWFFSDAVMAVLIVAALFSLPIPMISRAVPLSEFLSIVASTTSRFQSKTLRFVLAVTSLLVDCGLVEV